MVESYAQRKARELKTRNLETLKRLGYTTVTTKTAGSKEKGRTRSIEKAIAEQKTLGELAKAKSTKEAQEAINKLSEIDKGVAKRAAERFNVQADIKFKRGQRIFKEKEKKFLDQYKKKASIFVGKGDRRIASGTLLEASTRKKVEEKGPTILKEAGVEVFEQRIPIKGSILVSKKRVKLTQAELDKAKKFISDTQKVLLRGERADKVISKAESKIKKVISKIPGLKGDNFVQETIKNFGAGAILYFNPITGFPILGAKAAQLLDQAKQTGKLDADIKRILNKFEGDPNAYKKIKSDSFKSAVNSVGNNFDVRTPEGLANVLLVLTPIGVGALSGIKAPLIDVVSKTMKVSKASSSKFISSTVKSIGKVKGINEFVKSAEYVRQLAKAKSAIRSAQKTFLKLQKEAKGVKVKTVESLKKIKEEKLKLVERKRIDDLVLADARQLAKKKLTSKEVKKLVDLNKVRSNLNKKVNVLVKKSDALLKARLKIKGKIINRRLLININKMKRFDKLISRLENDLLTIIKSKKDVFRKVKVKKELKSLGDLERLRQLIKNDRLLEAKIKTKVKELKVKDEKIEKRNVFIERAAKDIKKLDFIKKKFVKEVEKLIKANKKAIKAGKKVKITKKTSWVIKNVDLIKKITSEFNKIKSFLKSKKSSIGMKDYKVLDSKINNVIKSFNNVVGKFKEQMRLSKAKIFRKFRKPGVEARIKKVDIKSKRGKKGKVKIKGVELTIELGRRRLLNVNKLAKRIKYNIKSIRRNAGKNVLKQVSNLKGVLRDEIKIFKDSKEANKLIKELLNEDGNIRRSIKQRRISLKRGESLRKKKFVLESITNEINKLKQDLRRVDDLIEINRRATGLGAKSFVDVNKVINDIIKESNIQRAKNWRELVKKKTGKPNTKAADKIIRENPRAFSESGVSGRKLLSVLESENVKPIVEVLNPTKFGAGFNPGKAIAGIISVVKPKGGFTPSIVRKPVIRPISGFSSDVIRRLIPNEKITPKIINVVDQIIKADSIIKVDKIISQTPKRIQAVVEKVVSRQKSVLRQKTKTKTKRRIFPPLILKLDKGIKLGRGERYTYNLRVKRAGKINVLNVKLPKNKALKKLRDTIDNSLSRSGELFVVGKTRSKDIKKVSLEGFRSKKSKDPKVLRIVETAKKALDTRREKAQIKRARMRKKKSGKRKTNKNK